MKKSVKEKVTSNLIKIGKKNRVCRALVLPAVIVWSSLFYCVSFCRENRKRLGMCCVSLLLFSVYSSFSFPMFITSPKEGNAMPSAEEMDSSIVLAEEEELDISNVKLLDDEDVLGGYRDREYGENPHGMGAVSQYDADDILKSTEGRRLTEGASAKQENSSGEERKFSKDDWRLVLINKQHSIPDDYTFELGYITDTMRCDERIIDDMRRMLQAAKEDQINLVVCSPYRDTSRQEMLFGRKIKRYMKQGMSYVEAYQLAGQAVTVPGASEHQIGLALDIVSDEYSALEEEFGDTAAGKWLAQNSCKFGFILRYPKGKEYITGIGYEPWHFRYVGEEAAAVITERGITLEEFWEELE